MASSEGAKIAAALSTRLDCPVVELGSEQYAKFMKRLFSARAAATAPACVVQPTSAQDVAKTFAVAKELGASVSVRGGGASPNCSHDRAIVIDMSAGLKTGELRSTDVVLGGGGTMGMLLQALEPIGRAVPIGVLPIPGLGLALSGGVGYFSRSQGLTLDFIKELEVVTPTGDILHLSKDSQGEEAELWWGMRGCGTQLGVATRATFRSFPISKEIYFHRLVVPLSALPTYFSLAPRLPRDVSASALLGPPAARPGNPLLLLLVAYAGGDESGIKKTQAAIADFLKEAQVAPLFEKMDIVTYRNVPPYDMPTLAGEFPPPPNPDAPVNERARVFEKCPFVGDVSPEIAGRLIDLLHQAPTPMCRLDIQHCGGAVADAPRGAMAFWNRDFEYNCPIIGISSPGAAAEEDACVKWVYDVSDALAPATAGFYSVEISPNLPETPKEVRQAFGDHLPRLQALKRRWDPDHLLRNYYSLT